MRPSDPVWYVSYGSNLHRARFDCYLSGGVPPGGSRASPGARDRRPPSGDRPVWIPGQVYFARRSEQWGGGVAFLDVDGSASASAASAAAGRAYAITLEQFTDVAAQESRRPIGSSFDVDAVLADGRLVVDDGWYGTLVRLDDIDGLPALTFTSGRAVGEVETTAPSAAYLRVIALGLQEAWGWTAEEIAAYVTALPGARGAWSARDVVALI